MDKNIVSSLFGNSDINLDPQVLRNSANQLNSAVNSIESVKSVLEQIEAQIYEAWNSGYTDEYVEYLNRVKNKAEKIIRQLTTIQEQLRKTAQRAEETEKQVQDIIRR